MTTRFLTRTSLLATLLVGTGLALAARLPDADVSAAEGKSENASWADAGMERLRSLAGEWIALDENGQPTDEVVSSVRTTAGGSAVVETLFGGSEHEMLTVYFKEGDKLGLTHYCVVGNQPHMVAAQSDDPDVLAFECAGGTNVDCPASQHMHSANLRWLGPDRLSTRWRMIENGEEMHVAEFELVRKR